MSQDTGHRDSGALTGRGSGSGTGSEVVERFSDPGLPAHVHRRADADPRAARRAERQVAILFALSTLGTVLFVVAYFTIDVGSVSGSSTSTKLLGLGMGLALLGIGAGAVHWAKVLMPDEEVVQQRHALRSSDADRADAVAVLEEGIEATGLARRKLIRYSLFGAVGPLLLIPVFSFRDLWLGRGDPANVLETTAWKAGVRLVTDDEAGSPVKASDIRIGEVLHIKPEGLNQGEGGTEDYLDEIGKAATILIRLEPGELQPAEVRENGIDTTGFDYNGLVAFSKICTHAGCPVGLYEQTTHHLLCPCHQSTFDVTRHAEVVFGPAARPLPQLAITVDEDGYLIARGDYPEPVGPSYWSRG